MKIPTALLGCILGAAALLAAVPETALADARSSPVALSAPAEARPPLSVQQGTAAESREYEQREAASPDAREFKGGYIATETIILIVVVIVIVIILL